MLTAKLKQYDYDLFIDGKWVPSSNGMKEDVINPATEEVIGKVSVGTMDNVDQAIQAARRAFDEGPWPRMSPRERSAKIAAFRDALKKREAELVDLIVAESGAIRSLASFQHVGMPLRWLDYWTEVAARNPMSPLPVNVNDTFSGKKVLGAGAMVRVPKGVVAAITPFNFPFFLNVAKVGPALTTGNTVVLKPSPFTPLEAFVLAEAAIEADLPEGVLNVVTGGTDVGQQLCVDPRVDMVTFTGSDTVGSAIMAQAAPTLKRVLLELGGKSPLIVRQDADLNLALSAGSLICTQSGQGCSIPTRQLVHNSLKEEYIHRLKENLEKVVVGNPADPQVTMGPLIRDKQRERVESFVQGGVEAGGTLVTGGRRPSLDKGYFYQPTLFTDVDNSWDICQEEIFGPVGVVIGFDTDEEAIRIANDSKFGLSAQIYSANVGKAFEMAQRIQSGQVLLNGGYGAYSEYIPFGGFKRSGLGREMGEEGINEYTEIKSILFHGA